MRIYFGKSSFIIPEGFEIQRESCLIGSDFSQSYNPLRGSGYVIVLIKKGMGFGNKMTYIFKKSDLNPNHYSPVLTLNSFLIGDDVESPLVYLKRAKETYISSLPKQSCHFCDTYEMGIYPAAQMQLEFEVDLSLTYLGLVWQWKTVLFHTSLILPSIRAEEGWKDLYKFAKSFYWEGQSGEGNYN